MTRLQRVMTILYCVLFLILLALAYLPHARAQELPVRYGYDLVHVPTGDAVNIYFNLRNWENPFLTEGLTFEVKVVQWENGQEVLNLAGLTANFFEFTPTRAGHYVVQVRINHPTDGLGEWYDSRQGQHDCADPCILEPGTIRPWMVFSWPKGVTGSGSIE